MKIIKIHMRSSTAEFLWTHHRDFEGPFGLQLWHQTQKMVFHQLRGRLSKHSGLRSLEERCRIILN